MTATAVPGRQPPEVAVVIPAYNVERTLRSTLESVRAQTLHDFEVAVVDDGSTDSTFQIAAAFAESDNRFKVIRQRNGGLADARNAGIRETQAPLVAALDADDVWHPTFLEKLSGALGAGGPDTVLAYTNARLIDLSGSVLRNAPSYDQSGWVLNQLLLLNFIGNGSAMMFRRDLAVQVGAYERRLQHEFGAVGAEDWLLALRLSARGRVAAVREFLVGYRSVPGAMSENTLRTRRSRLQALRILYSEVAMPDTQPARWALGIAHGKCFLHELRALLFRDAFRNLFLALWFDPLGTSDLLFGRERARWITRSGEDSGESDLGDFTDIDPLAGQDEVFSRRMARAREWDERRSGPTVSLGTAVLAQGAKGEVQ
jgi:glycosyltransferase involved in cell wall biosynthesis